MEKNKKIGQLELFEHQNDRLDGLGNDTDLNHLEVKKSMLSEAIRDTDKEDGYKLTKLGWIPEGWEVRRLENCASNERGSFTNGPFGSDLLSTELMDQGIPVIYVRDIKPNQFTWKSNVFVTEEKADKLSSCKIQKGDIILTKIGDPPCDAAVYENESISIITQLDFSIYKKRTHQEMTWLKL